MTLHLDLATDTLLLYPANSFIANHEVLLQFLFSPDSFGDEVEEEDERDAAGQPNTGAEAVATPKMRQRSDNNEVVAEATIVEDYVHKTTAETEASDRSPLLSEKLVIIEDWEPQDQGNRKDKENSDPDQRLLRESIEITLQESVDQLFGSSPFFSLMDQMNEQNDRSADDDDDDGGLDADSEASERQNARDVRDDWSFLCVEMAVCRRRRRMKENEEGDDSETRRLIERTKTIDRLMEARKQGDDVEGEQEHEEDEDDEERERHKRVMSRLQEAETWVNELDNGHRRKSKRKWRVINIESYLLATGTTGSLSVLSNEG